MFDFLTVVAAAVIADSNSPFVRPITVATGEFAEAERPVLYKGRGATGGLRLAAIQRDFDGGRMRDENK